MPGSDTGRGPSSASRPRLGVLLVTSGWFRDVGLQGADSGTSASVQKAGDDLVRRLAEIADVVCDGVVFSAPDAARAGRRVLDAEVDGVLLVPLMWCEDAIPRAALEHLRGLPLLIWTYAPAISLPPLIPFQLMLQGSGTVCTTQLSGMLRREGVEYVSIAGRADDPGVFATIAAFGRAAATRRALRHAVIGILPFPCDQMSATWVDEFGLRARYGTRVRHLELDRVRRVASERDPRELAAFRHSLESDGASIEVDERNLGEGIRYALALERLASEEGLSAIAMNDVIPEMHASFGLRPCLTNPSLSAAGVVVSMEADMGSAAAMLALRAFSGSSPFYTEPLIADYDAGVMIMGHAGYHDATNADPSIPVRVIPDVEYESSDRFTGAASYFKYRAGPVTAVNSVWDGERLRWCCVEGESLPGAARLEGNAHVVFRPAIELVELWSGAVRAGVSQHWLFIPGHVGRDLSLLCDILGVRFMRLDAAATAKSSS